ncbi:MAG: glucose 1-dehydrogenase [Myxococcales bacterium]|nr:MAG: glucose 1-dehydrogenase [Myxococcales bacterium]
MRLEGKTAIVTGGAGGVGRATSHVFAREGARVLVADRDEAGAQAVAEAAGEGARSFRVDVSVEAEVKAMVAYAERELGPVNVVFNNAGIFHDDDVSVLDTSEAVWDRVMNVNLKGVFFGCKYGIPAMQRAGGGSLINTSSLVALMGAAVSQCAYTASKGGVLALTREIAVEFARSRIRANALCPGPLNTELIAGLFKDEAAKQRRLIHIPMGRLGESDEIANAALFLASDESSFVTGTEFVVDGGITAAYVTPE